MSIDSDLEAMLAGWDSKPVSIGSWTGTGLLDEMDVLDVDRSGEPVLVRKTVLKVARAGLVDADGVATVARGDTTTVGGVTYVVSDIRVGGADGQRGGEELDGRELHLVVRKA